MRLTTKQKELVSRMKSGCLPAVNVEGEVYMTDGSPPPNRRTLNTLVRDGVVVPQNDGLFDGFTQTYALASN